MASKISGQSFSQNGHIAAIKNWLVDEEGTKFPEFLDENRLKIEPIDMVGDVLCFKCTYN